MDCQIGKFPQGRPGDRLSHNSVRQPPMVDVSCKQGCQDNQRQQEKGQGPATCSRLFP